MRLRVSYIVLLTMLWSGCTTHRFLGRNALRQTETLSHLLERQVLDNVAAFAENADTLPQFAVIGDGTSQVQDSGVATPTLMWNRVSFSGASLPLQGSRQLMENWKLQPVMSPGRLRRMRCAFQMLLARPTVFREGTEVWVPQDCINCVDELISVSLLPRPKCAKEDKSCVPEPGHWQFATEGQAAEYAAQLEAAIECRLPTGWFCIGTRKEAQREGCKIGSHCDTYVWVAPGGEDGFARFTLSILALATTDPAPGRQQLEISVAQAKTQLEGAVQGMEAIAKSGQQKAFYALSREYIDQANQILEQSDLGDSDLKELRMLFRGLKREWAASTERRDESALALSVLSQQAIQAINNLLQARAPQEDIFDRSGSMPFSRGGGIEFTPSIPLP